jgi:hypothetical protein
MQFLEGMNDGGPNLRGSIDDTQAALVNIELMGGVSVWVGVGGESLFVRQHSSR